MRGPQREAQIGAADRLGQPRGAGQRGEADVAALAHHLQALRHEGTVEPLQLRHIGDGAERDQIEQVDQLRLGPVGEEAAPAQFAQQRRAQQEGDTHRRQMAVRRALALVEPVGVHQRMGHRQRGGAFVVIDDDHVHHRRARHLQRVERLRAAIDRHDQPRAALGDPHQRLA